MVVGASLVVSATEVVSAEVVSGPLVLDCEVSLVDVAVKWHCQLVLSTVCHRS